MGFSTATANLLILVTILISLAGAVLLWIGYRGRRVGSEPRCRRCGYNLTGAASATCPECGGHGDDIGVVHGLRRRRPVLMLAGIVLVLSGGMFLGFKGYQRVQTINVYRYYPAGWVLDAAIAGQPAALTELARRLRAEGLSDKHRDRLATFALAEQGATTPGGMLQAWVDMLEFLYQAGDLTDAQAEQYFEQMRIYTLAVRASVCAGDPIPIELCYTSRGPLSRSQDPDRWIKVEIDGRKIGVHSEQPKSPSSLRGIGTERSISCATTGNAVGGTGFCGPFLADGLDAAGSYQLTLDFTELVYRDGADRPSDLTYTVRSRELRESVRLNVVSHTACTGIRLSDDPLMAAKIREAIDLEPLQLDCSDEDCKGAYASLMIHTGSGTQAGADLPIDVAFDVLVRFAELELDLGTVLLRAGRNHGDHVYQRVGGFEADAVDVVLRANPEAARLTVNVTEVWDGELVFEDVLVERRGQ
jgi:hypothetical protein